MVGRRLTRFRLLDREQSVLQDRDRLDQVFRVDKRRPFALRKVLAFALVGILSVLLVASVVVEGLLSTIDRFIDTTALAPLKELPLYKMWIAS